jgi:hypothetical protein
MMRRRSGCERWMWRESEADEECGETKKLKSRMIEKGESPSMEEGCLEMRSSSNPLWWKWSAWICDGQRVEEEPSLLLRSRLRLFPVLIFFWLSKLQTLIG